jgi:ribosomal protein S18 acetylase RimI-like enzyme
MTGLKERESMLFRRYMTDDFPALYSIEERCFEPRFRFGRGYMQHLVSNPEAVAWVAEEDGVMAGFAIVAWGKSVSADGGYLQTIEVLPEFRNRGVGEKLVGLSEISAWSADSDTLSLHVDAENEAAIALYEKCGYRRRGRRDHYYARGRAALLYEKQLDAVAAVDLQNLGLGYSAA